MNVQRRVDGWTLGTGDGSLARLSSSTRWFSSGRSVDPNCLMVRCLIHRDLQALPVVSLTGNVPTALDRPP